MKFIKFIKLRDVKSPSRATNEAAGIDFFIPNDYKNVELLPNESINIKSGISLILDKNTAGIFFNKSSIGVLGLIVGAQVIDSDYRGEVHLNVINTSKNIITLKPGMKLTQLIILPVILDDLLEIHIDDYDVNTVRGTNGFGSSGS